MSSMICIEPHYMGGTNYFSLLCSFEEVKLEAHEHFVKQTFRNRCRILTANGNQDLIVPVHFSNRTPFGECKIDYNQAWVRDHKGAIQSAYAKAPFFDHYYPRFEKVWDSKPTFLLDLNLELLTICLELLKIKLNVSQTTVFEKPLNQGEFDARDSISPKNEEMNGIKFPEVSYLQNFGNKFVQGLSVLDTLMCLGNEAPSVILKSSRSIKEQLSLSGC